MGYIKGLSYYEDYGNLFDTEENLKKEAMGLFLWGDEDHRLADPYVSSSIYPHMDKGYGRCQTMMIWFRFDGRDPDEVFGTLGKVGRRCKACGWRIEEACMNYFDSICLEPYVEEFLAVGFKILLVKKENPPVFTETEIKTIKELLSDFSLIVFGRRLSKLR
jgi:hypothetical protein